MNSKLVLAACLAFPLTFAACSKQEKAPAADQAATSEVVVEESSNVTPEQQAAIDALDKPLQDENNTDIPESVANAPADQATSEETIEASAAQ